MATTRNDLKMFQSEVGRHGLSHRFIDAVARSRPAAVIEPDTYDPGEIAEMLREIGIALLESHQPSQVVAKRLGDIAARYTTAPVRVAALPTLLIVQVGSCAYEVDTSTTLTLQLDRAGRADDIATLAGAGAITPRDAVDAIRRSRVAPPRFGTLTTMVGYVIASLGFALLIHPAWSAMPAHVFLGFVVAAILQLVRRIPAVEPVVPILAAAVTSALAAWFVAEAAHESLLTVVTPALVALLPGVSLTVSAVELAGGQIVAGASRSVYAIAQLAMLAFGAAKAVHAQTQIAPPIPPGQLIPGSLYLAIVLMALGLYVYLSGPRGSLPWLILAIGLALLSQKVAANFVAPLYAGFVGALVLVPFAMFAARLKTAPPAMVMMLAAFWALVPGALGLASLSHAAAGHTGVGGITAAGSAVLSLALGTMVGWSVFQQFSNWTGSAPAEH